MLQVKSRLGMCLTLPSLSKSDCDLLGAAYNVEGIDAYEAVRSYGKRTTARELVKLLCAAQHNAAHENKGVRLADLKLTLLGLKGSKSELTKLTPPS